MSAHSHRDSYLELDSGGFGRLDISDLADAETDNGHEGASLTPESCGWCRETRTGGGDYLVVADNRHFHLCPTCWGRSAAYVELRQAGIAHEAALSKVTSS
jgi:hypothetical protein